MASGEWDSVFSLRCLRTQRRRPRFLKFVHTTLVSSFVQAYAVVAYYFSAKMMRLIILMGPIASALAGIPLGMTTSWARGGGVYGFQRELAAGGRGTREEAEWGSIHDSPLLILVPTQVLDLGVGSCQNQKNG